MVALGAFLRLYRLGTQPFWIDEAFTAAVSFHPLREITRYDQNHPPGYYALVYLWSLGGHGEAWLRLLSVLPGLLTIPLCYLLGRALFEPRRGLLVAAVLTVSAFHVYYSRELRMYPLLILLIVGQMLFLCQALQFQSRRALGAYAACSLLAIYTHYLAGEAIAAGLLCCALRWCDLSRETRRTVVAIHLAIFVGGALALVRMMFASTHSGQFPWCFSSRHALTAPIGVLYGFAFNAAVLPPPPPFDTFVLPATVLVLLLLVIGIVPNTQAPASRTILLCYAVVPALGSWTLASWTTFVEPKYWSPLFPAFCLLTGAGLDRLWRKRPVLALGSGAVLLVMAMIGIAIALWPGTRAHPDWRGATMLIQRNFEPGDIVAVPPYHRVLPDIYTHHRLPVLEACMRDLADREGKTLSRAQLTHRYRRLWAVFRDSDSSSGSSLRLALLWAAPRQVSRWRLHGLEVRLYYLGQQ